VVHRGARNSNPEEFGKSTSAMKCFSNLKDAEQWINGGKREEAKMIRKKSVIESDDDFDEDDSEESETEGDYDKDGCDICLYKVGIPLELLRREYTDSDLRKEDNSEPNGRGTLFKVMT